MKLRILVLFCTTLVFSDQVRSIKTETGCKIHNTFNEFGLLIRSHSSDGSIDYSYDYIDSGIEIHNCLTGEILIQQVNKSGQVIYEKFPSGLEIALSLENSQITNAILPDKSEIEYTYSSPNSLKKVIRKDSEGTVLYAHKYIYADDRETHQELIGNLGLAHCLYYEGKSKLKTTGPTCTQEYQFDENLNMLSQKIGKSLNSYSYNENNELLTSEPPFVQTEYDELGRLVSKGGTQKFQYDALNRLISVDMPDKHIKYTYDPSGRRLSKSVHKNGMYKKEHYLYLGNIELGVYDENNELKYLRVPGRSVLRAPFSVAIETRNKTYAPIYGQTLNIIQLVDISSKQIIDFSALDPFGENLSSFPYFPWIFSAKNFDPDSGLVYFGCRYYDPSIRKWISRDPIETTDDPYLYVGNNPLRHFDPDGRSFFLFSMPLYGAGALASLPALAPAAGAIAIGAFSGYIAHKIGTKIIKKLNESKHYEPYSKREKNPKSKEIVLTKQQKKAIKSLEKRIKEHESKLQKFQKEPTTRPGMEGRSKEEIVKQQHRRMQHLKTEIETFKRNTEKIKQGKLNS